jgi:hypothetical protein
VRSRVAGGDGGNFIPSLLDGNLSPLEILINCEILSNIMILFHIFLLVLILIQKFNLKVITKSSVGFIRKFVNKYKLNKLQNFINKIGEWSNKYLTILLLINACIIVFYVLLNVYINIELSSNLNEYIHVYTKFQIKKGGILLLLLNCNIKSYSPGCVLVSNKNKNVKSLLRGAGGEKEKRMFSCSKLNKNSDKGSSVLTGNDLYIGTEIVSITENNNKGKISLSNINHLVVIVKRKYYKE